MGESLELIESDEEPSSKILFEHLITGVLDTGNVYNDDQEDDSLKPAPLPKPLEALNAA